VRASEMARQGVVAVVFHFRAMGPRSTDER